MSLVRTFLAPCTVLAAAALSLPALAASSAASSASESLTTSSGSVSDSSNASSDSSRRPARQAQGDYRVVEVAAMAERPGTLRLMLEPAAGQGEGFALYVPQKAVDQASVATGQVVRAEQRPYGVQFARGDTQQAFFLMLDDEWYRELPSNPVVL
ncbi:MAG TPA: hypothetical protein VGQ91_11105 [Ideonella sp.]|nr:hypothetical protein [Ideonella sp.]